MKNPHLVTEEEARTLPTEKLHEKLMDGLYWIAENDQQEPAAFAANLYRLLARNPSLYVDALKKLRPLVGSPYIAEVTVQLVALLNVPPPPEPEMRQMHIVGIRHLINAGWAAIAPEIPNPRRPH